MADDRTGITVATLQGQRNPVGTTGPNGHTRTGDDAARYAGPDGAIVNHVDLGGADAVIITNPVKAAGPGPKFPIANRGRSKRH